jgi:hypothetical protein
MSADRPDVRVADVVIGKLWEWHSGADNALGVLEVLGIPEDWTMADLRIHMERGRRASDLGWLQQGNEAYFANTWTDNAAEVAEYVYADGFLDPDEPEDDDSGEFDDFDRVLLENTDLYLICHKGDRCAGEVCTMHNRSDHSMRSFPQRWRGDRGIMERICPHGVGHPDPDEYRIISGQESDIHGCDGCCSPTVTVPMDDYPKLRDYAPEWKDSTFRIPDLSQFRPSIGTVDYRSLKIYTDLGWEDPDGGWREAARYPVLYETIGDTFSPEDHPLGWFKLPDFTTRIVVSPEPPLYDLRGEYSVHGHQAESLPWNRHRKLYLTNARFYNAVNQLTEAPLITPQQSIEILIDALAGACQAFEDAIGRAG